MGLPAKRLILLGPGPAGAFAFAGGDDQDGDARTWRFLESLGSLCLTFAVHAAAISL